MTYLNRLDTVLADAGYTHQDTSSEFRTYINQETSDRIEFHFCDIKQLKKVHISRLTVRPSSQGTLSNHIRCTDIERRKHVIEHLILDGDNYIAFDAQPLRLAKLHLNNSALNKVHTRGSKQPIQSLYLNHSRLVNSAIKGNPIPGETIRIYHSFICRTVIAATNITINISTLRGPLNNWDWLTVNQSLRAYTLCETHAATTSYPEGPMYVLPHAPCGVIPNLRGDLIAYTAYINRKGKIYIRLGCWFGSLEQAHALINGPVQDYPSYNGSTVDPQIYRETQKRYKALLKSIRK